jgi:hypothetical protein
MDPLILVKAHSKSNNRSKSGPKTSVILYLLTQYGLADLLNKIGFTSNSIFFSVTDLYTDLKRHQDTPDIQYYQDKYDLSKYLTIKIKDNFYLNAIEQNLENKFFRRVIVSILNAFKATKAVDINALLAEERIYWKFLLGKCIYGSSVPKPSLLLNHVGNHLKSLSTYLDPITILQLDKLGIYCKDIFELFLNVFLHLDDWLVNKTVTNLYEKKIGVLDLLLAEIVKRIFNHFYSVEQQHQALTEKNIIKLLKLNSRIINNIYKCDVLHSSPSQYNDNALITILGKKSRQPANQNSKKKQTQDNILNSPDHRFDATFGGIESLYTIPSSSPGIGGSINPFVEIDNEGCFIKSDWIKPLEELIKYLPRS